MAENDRSNKVFLSKTSIMFNQTNMFQSCSQIQDWIGWEGCYLVCNPSKISIASYFNNMEPTKHICYSPYVNNFIMCTGSPHMQIILSSSPYAYRGQILTYQRAYLLESSIEPELFECAHQKPYGDQDHSPYAYGDDGDPCLHTGIA